MYRNDMLSGQALVFGPFHLDLDNGVLLRAGKSVRLRPKSFAVLAHLARRPGEVVSRAALFDAVWGDQPIREDALSVSISEIRRVLQDTDKHPAYIQTVRGRGFRLLAQAQTPPRQRAALQLIDAAGSAGVAGTVSRHAHPNGGRRSAAAQFRFGRFELDTDHRELRRTGRPLKVRAKTFAVLAFLVQHASRVIEREEILAAVWHDVAVKADVLTTSLVELRRILGDSARRPRFIETVHGRGVRFVAKVDVTRAADLSPPDAHSMFVGRAEALSDLWQALNRSVAGSRHVGIITGPAGIGKSRLLQEFIQRARRAQVLVLEASGDDASQHSALWLWAQILRNFAAASSPAALRHALGAAAPDIAAAIPSIRQRLALKETAPTLEPALARARIFDGITSFLARLTDQQPLVLAFDDLHTAGASSLALLQAVLTAPDMGNLLVLAALRDEGRPDPPLSAFLEAVRCGNNGVHVALSGLSGAETRQLVALTAGQTVPAKLAERIAHDTAGNPYFVVEIVKSLRQASFDDAAQHHYAVPENLRRFIEARLRLLSADAQALLKIAAVAGSTFDLRLVAAVAGLDMPALWRSAAEGLRAEVLRQPNADGDLQFHHNVVRETLLSDMSELERADVHRRIAAALEQRAADSEPDLMRLAFHFLRATAVAGPSKAIDYSLRAGERALDNYFDEEARQLLSQALDLATKSEEAAGPRLYRILERLAEAQLRLGQFDAAETLAERLHCMARAQRQSGWQAKAAIAMLGRAHLPYRPDVDKPIAALHDALAALGDEPTPLRGQAAARLAAALLMKVDCDAERIARGRQAVAVARQIDDPAARPRLLYEALLAFWDADHTEERLALAGELREAAIAVGNVYLECAALAWQALTVLTLGRWHELEAIRRAAIRANAGTRYEIVERYERRIDMSLALQHGDFAEAERLIREHGRYQRFADPLWNTFEVLFVDMKLKRERGELAALTPMVRFLAAEHPTLPLRWVVPFLLVEEGSHAEAAALLESVFANELRDLPPRNDAWCWLAIVAALGEACAEVGSQQRAAQLYELLAPYAGQWIVVHETATVFACAGTIAGRLAARCGNLDRAEQHFRAVIEACERQNARTELARALLAYAEALQTRNPAAAQTFLQRALDLAAAHGLLAIQRRAAALRENLCTPLEPSVPRRRESRA